MILVLFTAGQVFAVTVDDCKKFSSPPGEGEIVIPTPIEEQSCWTNLAIETNDLNQCNFAPSTNICVGSMAEEKRDPDLIVAYADSLEFPKEATSDYIIQQRSMIRDNLLAVYVQTTKDDSAWDKFDSNYMRDGAVLLMAGSVSGATGLAPKQDYCDNIKGGYSELDDTLYFAPYGDDGESNFIDYKNLCNSLVFGIRGLKYGNDACTKELPGKLVETYEGSKDDNVNACQNVDTLLKSQISKMVGELGLEISIEELFTEITAEEAEELGIDLDTLSKYFDEPGEGQSGLPQGTFRDDNLTCPPKLGKYSLSQHKGEVELDPPFMVNLGYKGTRSAKCSYLQDYDDFGRPVQVAQISLVWFQTGASDQVMCGDYIVQGSLWSLTNQALITQAYLINDNIKGEFETALDDLLAQASQRAYPCDSGGSLNCPSQVGPYELSVKWSGQIRHSSNDGQYRAQCRYMGALKDEYGPDIRVIWVQDEDADQLPCKRYAGQEDHILSENRQAKVIPSGPSDVKDETEDLARDLLSQVESRTILCEGVKEESITSGSPSQEPDKADTSSESTGIVSRVKDVISRLSSFLKSIFTLGG